MDIGSLRIEASPINGEIFVGTKEEDGKTWKERKVVTTEAAVAVAKSMMADGEEEMFVTLAPEEKGKKAIRFRLSLAFLSECTL